MQDETEANTLSSHTKKGTALGCLCVCVCVCVLCTRKVMER